MKRARRWMTMVLAAVVLPTGVANGEGIWDWSHVATGSGCADVNGGSPVPLCDSSDTVVPFNPDMIFTAVDLTQPGSMGASVTAAGQSAIATPKDALSMGVEFDARYLGSLFPGGDNPGGTAEAELSSVIEFVMPVDQVEWSYVFRVRDTLDFEGSTQVVFENVTQGETLLELSTGFRTLFGATLTANAGDVMRLTTLISGGGTTIGGARGYEVDLDMRFTIPEPGTMTLLAAGVPLIFKRRRHYRIGRQVAKSVNSHSI